MIKATKKQQDQLIELQLCENEILKIEYQNSNIEARQILKQNKERLKNIKLEIEKETDRLNIAAEENDKAIAKEENLKLRLERILEREKEEAVPSKEVSAMELEKKLIKKQIEETIERRNTAGMKNINEAIDNLKSEYEVIRVESLELAKKTKQLITDLQEKHNIAVEKRNKIEEGIEPKLLELFKVGKDYNNGLGVALLKENRGKYFIEGLNIELSNLEVEKIKDVPKDYIFILEENNMLIINRIDED